MMRLLSPTSNWRMNDSYANDAGIRHRTGAAEVSVNPQDAKRLGISDGQTVRLSNGGGALELQAKVDANMLPGVLLSYKGRWPKQDGGNLNFLNTGIRSDIANATAVHSTEVALEPIGSVSWRSLLRADLLAL
jgi:anaerobic dimethyl sulfoxide reductase subunit A